MFLVYGPSDWFRVLSWVFLCSCWKLGVSVICLYKSPYFPLPTLVTNTIWLYDRLFYMRIDLVATY